MVIKYEFITCFHEFSNLRNVFHEIFFFTCLCGRIFSLKRGNVTVYVFLRKKKAQKKYHRFVVTEFVKTCDELVIGSNIHFQNQQPRYCSVRNIKIMQNLRQNKRQKLKELDKIPKHD